MNNQTQNQGNGLRQPQPPVPGGQPPIPQSGQPNQAPSTPFVLGVLSIIGGVLFAIAGLILGIAAIITSNKQLKVYGPERAPRASTARICGIVGIAISCIQMVLSIVLMSLVMFFAATSTSEYDESLQPLTKVMEIAGLLDGSGIPEASTEDITPVVDACMTDVLSGTSRVVAEEVQDFMDDVDDLQKPGMALTFKPTGMQAATISKALMNDASYTIDSIEVIGDAAFASVTVTNKTLTAVQMQFNEALDADRAQNPSLYNEGDKAVQQIRTLYESALTQTAPVEHTLMIVLEKDRAQWVIDEDEMDYIVDECLYAR